MQYAATSRWPLRICIASRSALFDSSTKMHDTRSPGWDGDHDFPVSDASSVDILDTLNVTIIVACNFEKLAMHSQINMRFIMAQKYPY